MLVDSHCHLDFPEFAPELGDVVARAKTAGVGVCVTIGTKLPQFPNVRAVAERFPDVWCSVGIHPHEAEHEPLDGPEILIEHAGHPKVVGIGESGLDYYYERSPREAQRANFRHHVAASRVTGLPLIVHTRDADDDTIAILEDEMARAPFTGLLHCFTGTRRLAEAALALGFYISASGIATFKNSAELRAVLKDVPPDRLLVETDAPYLAPLPYRGKRNEPSYVVEVAKVLAEVRGVSFEEISRQTTENFFKLFGKVSRAAAAAA
jgi:TatD DNase family protein